MATTVFTGGRILFTGAGGPTQFQESMVITGDQIVHVGREDDVETARAQSAGAHIVDLQNQVVVPGFIDGHSHILHFGLSLRKVDIVGCSSLEEIRRTIKDHAQAHPELARVLVKGWNHVSTDGVALASMIDDLDPRPIYIEASDLHSTWCNSAALGEMGVQSRANPAGGTIHRDELGRASGLLDEAAHFDIVWPHLANATSREEKVEALHDGLSALSAAGYTGLVDMAMDEQTWEVLHEFCTKHKPPMHIAVHWLIPYTDNQTAIFRHIDRAVELTQQFNVTTSPSLYVTGIKLIGDGVVDGCTVALHQPYTSTGGNADPIWPKDAMIAAVRRADAAGLQCAIHAIGDRTVSQAIDALALVANPTRRHRIEHLELTTVEDARRLGALGITASVQPVHSDPAVFTAWPHLIGPHRCQRAFAYKEFLDGGAALAFGTDAPTAKHLPLPNLYNATTRRSAINPSSTDTVNEQYAVSLAAAVTAATTGAAYSCRADDWTGSLKPGYKANFVVFESDWTPENLLQSRVCQTWFEGRKVFDVGGAKTNK